jgi:hypothetical protein
VKVFECVSTPAAFLSASSAFMTLRKIRNYSATKSDSVRCVVRYQGVVPSATEITARFKDSQNHFQDDQTYVWLPPAPDHSDRNKETGQESK